MDKIIFAAERSKTKNYREFKWKKIRSMKIIPAENLLIINGVEFKLDSLYILLDDEILWQFRDGK